MSCISKDVNGYIIASVSATISAAMAFLIKSLSFSLNMAELYALKHALQVIVMLPFTFVVRKQITATKFQLSMLILLCLMKSVGCLSGYYAFLFISVSDTTAILNSRYIFILPLARFWLKEKIGVLDILSIIVSVISIVMICQPASIFGSSTIEMTTSRALGIGITLSAAAFSSATRCIQRKLKGLNLQIMILIPAIASIVFGAILIPVQGQIQNPFAIKNWHLLIVFLIASTVGSIGQVAATQQIPAISIIITMAIKTSLTVFLDIMIMGLSPNIFTVIGLFLSSVSVLLLPLKTCFSKTSKADENENLLPDP